MVLRLETVKTVIPRFGPCLQHTCQCIILFERNIWIGAFVDCLFKMRDLIEFQLNDDFSVLGCIGALLMFLLSAVLFFAQKADAYNR